MILANLEIQALCVGSTQNDLIHPFYPENLRRSSYDLTVGDEYYIEQDDAALTVSTQRLKAKQSFRIPPHAVCFILAAEHICLPDTLTAKVSLRMTHIYAGMVLTSQPPFDPGYQGRVVVMLYNLSSQAYPLKAGDRLATIEFSRLGATPSPGTTHRRVNGLEEQLIGPVASSLAWISTHHI